jgi:hypothetical protein
MDCRRERTLGPSRHLLHDEHRGLGLTGYLSYIAGQACVGSKQMTHPYVFKDFFAQLMPSGVS